MLFLGWVSNIEEMSTPSSVVDLHSNQITLDVLRNELRTNPSRLEERKERDKHYRDLRAGNTPIMTAVCFENMEMCEFLLSVGANIDSKNEVWTSLVFLPICEIELSFAFSLFEVFFKIIFMILEKMLTKSLCFVFSMDGPRWFYLLKKDSLI